MNLEDSSVEQILTVHLSSKMPVESFLSRLKRESVFHQAVALIVEDETGLTHPGGKFSEPDVVVDQFILDLGPG